MSWLRKCGRMAPAICVLLVCGNAQCAPTVTASKDYVDKRTSMSPVYEDGNTNAVVGYRIGIHTNSVLASRESVSNITSSAAGMVASSTNGLTCLLTNGTIVAAKAGSLRDGSGNVRTAETIFSQIDTSFLEITNSAAESARKYRTKTDMAVYDSEDSIVGTLATMAEVGLRTTTNDVCNIVTNRVTEFIPYSEIYDFTGGSEWELTPEAIVSIEYVCGGELVWDTDVFYDYWKVVWHPSWASEEEVTGYNPYLGPDETHIMAFTDIGGFTGIEFYCDIVVRDALGLARHSDIPTKTSNLTNDGDGWSPFATLEYVDGKVATRVTTNDVCNIVTNVIGPVRVGADTNVEKDVSVRIGFGAYSSSLEQNQSPHNGWKRGIAIGQYAIASAAGVSIGPFAGMSSGSTSGSISIGLNSTAANQDAIAIGNGAGWTGVDDTSNMGKFSVAIGASAGSEGDDSSALGSKAYAFGGGSVAVGNRAKAGTESISIGRDSSTSNCNSAIAIGQKATTSAQRSIAIGHNSRAAINGLAIGSHTQSDNTEAGGSSIAIGAGAKSCTVSGDSGISIGYLAKTPNGGTAIGANAVANSSAIAIGTWSAATGSWATANGYKATARVNGATSVGAWADASGLGSIAIGGGRGGWGASPSQSPAAAAKATESIQLGVGTNSVANTFQVWSHRMLDKSTGKIPAERIPDSIFSTNNAAFVAAVTNCPVTVSGADASEIGAGTYGTIGAIIAALVAAVAALKRGKVTTISAQSTDEQYPSAKCVWDLVGDVESALAAITGTANGGSGT